MSGLVSRTLVLIFFGAASLFVVFGYLALRILGVMLAFVGISAFKTAATILEGQKANVSGLFSEQVSYSFDLVKGYVWILPIGTALSVVAALSQNNPSWFWSCLGITIFIWLFYAGMSIGLDGTGFPQHTKSRQKALAEIEVIRLREELNNRSGD